MSGDDSMNTTATPMAAEFSLITMLVSADSFYAAFEKENYAASANHARDVIRHLAIVVKSAIALRTRAAAFLPFLRVFVPTFYAALRALESQTATATPRRKNSDRRRTSHPRSLQADASCVALATILRENPLLRTHDGIWTLSRPSPCPLCGQRIPRRMKSMVLACYGSGFRHFNQITH